jgi:hypothetical protein
MGLAGRRIVGGMRTKAQGRAEERRYALVETAGSGRPSPHYFWGYHALPKTQTKTAALLLEPPSVMTGCKVRLRCVLPPPRRQPSQPGAQEQQGGGLGDGIALPGLSDVDGRMQVCLGTRKVC